MRQVSAERQTTRLCRCSGGSETELTLRLIALCANRELWDQRESGLVRH
jgi:hypothetical protein